MSVDLRICAALAIIGIAIAAWDDRRWLPWTHGAFRSLWNVLTYPYWWVASEITHRRILRTLNRPSPGWHNFRVR